MLRVERRVREGTPTEVLSLPYDARKKSRLRARTESGRELAIVLERGSMLRHGDLLAAESGEIVMVRAAAESVSDVTTADAVLLAKAAYHLGNRHVPLQIEHGALRYQHDHVLDEMIAALGLQVTPRTAAFEPEGGAYAGGHSHSHGESRHEHGAAEVDDKGGAHVHGDVDDQVNGADYAVAEHSHSHGRGHSH